MSRWRIDRKRVVSFLESMRQTRIVLIVAQAGYGKSIALRQYLQRAREPFAFFRVEPETATLLGFLRGLTESLESFIPGAHLSLTMAHERAMQSRTPFVELSNWLGEHLREASLRIVIDDLHNATSDAIPDFLSRATAGTPESIKWMIAARPTATFSPAPWLARGEIDWPIDETILRFTPDELRDLARVCGIEASQRQLDGILELTQGWPSAAALGLVRSGDVDHASSRSSISDLYDALARGLFAGYDSAVQEFLLQTSVYDSLDVSVLDADGRRNLFVRVFEQDGVYIDQVNEDSYRYDGLLRSYLLRMLGERGADFERQTYERAGLACENAGRWPQALILYRKAASTDAVLRILKERGFALVETGALEVVESAVEALSEPIRDHDPTILALKAVLDSDRARFDTSEAWFRLAIHDLKDEHLRLQIVYRYTLDLLRRGRLDCIELLEPAIESAAEIKHELHPMLCATLATAYTLADRFDDARALIEQALPALKPPLPEALLARGYHQASYVAIRCRNIADAERYSLKARDIAVSSNLYDLAARASSILYEIAYAWNANLSQALEYVENVASFALRSGDVALQDWALVAAYYIEAERGNGRMMSAIERSLDVADVLQMANETASTLVPGQALRATWTGDFERAYRLLLNTADSQQTADLRAMSWAEVALYAAAAGLKDEANDALRATRAQLAAAGDGKLATHALAYALITASLLNRRERRRVIRADARLTKARPSIAALVRAADVLDAYWAGNGSQEELLDVLNELYAFDFAGIAMMLESMPAFPKVSQNARRL
jgi:ATP/maltotriose-dependent transcriptional regulator MalT